MILATVLLIGALALLAATDFVLRHLLHAIMETFMVALLCFAWLTGGLPGGPQRPGISSSISRLPSLTQKPSVEIIP